MKTSRKQRGTAAGFPVGSVYRAEYGVVEMELHFDSEKLLAYTIAKGPAKGTSTKVPFSVMPVRPGLFMISWKDPDGAMHVHVEDFEKGVSCACIARPGGKLIRMRGTLERAELPVLCT